MSEEQEIEPGSYEHRFGGIGRLYGEQAWEKIRAAKMLVIGVGGVGCWAAEALARAGVGHITLMDWDDICFSNTNRQLHAMNGNVGRSKTDVLAERIRLINPECEVESLRDFYSAENSDELLSQGWDVVLDCIDSVEAKCLLIAKCKRAKIKIVSCGGAGGRHHAEDVQIDDLARTYDDPLLSRVRRVLRTEHGLSMTGKKKFGVPTVFTPEDAKYPQSDGCVSTQKSGEGNMKLDCRSGFGTASWITGTFGFIMASTAINILLDNGAPYHRRENNRNY